MQQAQKNSGYAGEINCDLPCPSCKYNLRSQVGPVLTCPECGNTCDLRRDLGSCWKRAWCFAPWLNRVSLSAAWLCLSMVCSVLYTAFYSGWPYATVEIRVGLAAFSVWVVLFFPAWLFFRDIRGLWVPALAHAAVILLTAGTGGIVACLIAVIASLVLFTGDSIGHALVIVLPSCFLFWAGWSVAKDVARACIKRFNERRLSAAHTAKGDSPANVSGPIVSPP